MPFNGSDSSRNAMMPDCVKCGQPMRLFWSLSKLRSEKWVTEECYECPSCGHMQEEEIAEPFWVLWQKGMREINSPDLHSE